MIWRTFPPNGSGTCAPCTVAICVRMKLSPKSYICCSDIEWLDRLACRIGTFDALKRMISGGVDPGGIARTTACEIAVICETAASIDAPG